MILYLLMLCIIFGIRPFIVDDFSQDVQKKQQTLKAWLTVSCVILSLIEGLRSYTVGTDTVSYVAYFWGEKTLDFEEGFELFTKAIRLFTDNATIYLLCIAFTINGLVVRAIYKMSKDTAVSLFAYITLYYYFNSFNGLRQYMAVALVMTTYTFLREKKFLKAMLTLLVAVQFHKSSVIGILLLPMYIIGAKSDTGKQGIITPFSQISLSEPLRRIKRAMIFMGVFILFFIGFDLAIRTVTNIFPQYRYYLYSDYGMGTAAIQQKIIYSVILIVYLLFSEEEEWLIPMAYTVSMAFLMSRIKIMGRFLWYFDIFSIFAIAEVWHSNHISKDTLLIVRICIGLACFAFMVYYLFSRVMRVVPYRFIFLKVVS